MSKISLHTLQKLTTIMGDGLLIFDDQLKITYVSALFMDGIGYREHELRGTTVNILLSFRDTQSNILMQNPDSVNFIKKDGSVLSSVTQAIYQPSRTLIINRIIYV